MLYIPGNVSTVICLVCTTTLGSVIIEANVVKLLNHP